MVKAKKFEQADEALLKQVQEKIKAANEQPTVSVEKAAGRWFSSQKTLTKTVLLGEAEAEVEGRLIDCFITPLGLVAVRRVSGVKIEKNKLVGKVEKSTYQKTKVELV